MNQNQKLLWPQWKLASRLNEFHKAGEQLAFTNGCFDILHAGHVEFLEWAKAQAGDKKLLVALNTDESVRRLKGPTRPINAQADRAAVIAALSAVDLVTFFNEDNPYDLLGLVKPVLIVKSSQYAGEDTPERRYARKWDVDLFYGPYLAEHSTTKILEKNSARLNLITEIANFLYESTESFNEEQVGADLAYLLSAIASGGECQWPADQPIVELLRKGKPPDHEIWRVIEIEKEE
jgi:rfaE bifunctional protein nucleotidyltransferase chain/domain